MKWKFNPESPDWLLYFAVVVFVADVILAWPVVLTQPTDYQTFHFGLLALAAGLVFAARVESRMHTLETKLDELLTIREYSSLPFPEELDAV